MTIQQAQTIYDYINSHQDDSITSIATNLHVSFKEANLVFQWAIKSKQ